MPHSMTGYASAAGAWDAWRWVWEIRSVNGRGLDLRLRLPDWIEGLDARVRAGVTGRVARGSVTMSLKITRDDSAAGGRIDPAGLDRALDHVAQVLVAADDRDLALSPPTAAEILAMRGVIDAGPADDGDRLASRVLDDLPALLDAFATARAEEGAALHTMIEAQLDEIAAGIETARDLAIARRDRMAETLQTNLARVMGGASGADPDRVAQELALIAVKADVTEELDRLSAHVEAARGLLSDSGPVGRKFDFLAQEFNREANTLCSKAQNSELTRVGLDLKTVIDQMREQIQNME